MTIFVYMATQQEELYYEFELSLPENPTSTACDMQNHWTAVSTLFRSHQQCIP